MKSKILRTFFLIIIFSLIESCSSISNIEKFKINCFSKDEKGNLIRTEYGYNFTLIDSTGLYIYTHQKMSSPYGPTNKLFLFTRKLVKYVYFSETRCSEIFPLRYDRLKKKLKIKYPDFIKEINQFSDHELITPIDSLSKTPRVNIIFNKYKKK